MKRPGTIGIVIFLACALCLAIVGINKEARSAEVEKDKLESAANMTFPLGTATPSEECGACHRAIYREFALGFGSDTKYKKMVLRSAKEQPFSFPANVSSTSTAHAAAGLDPFPIHAREAEEEGKQCNVCHFPEPFAIPDMETLEIPKPKSRAKGLEAGGLTCASCHLTPDGKIRGPYQVNAPHPTVEDPAIRTSAMCAYCHSMGKRVVGKQTQTFLEWREDFHKPDLGRQHCQDCHMLRTERKVAEDFDVPVRAVARHLWTGGHSFQRIANALNITVVQPEEGKANVEFHVVNINAGHSVPTGSNRRAVYLIADAIDSKGKTIASKEWMFAPWYGPRPDDKAFLEEDKKRPDAVAATQADAQGPHETSIRAGEERVLIWTPELKPGEYTVRPRLVYSLNRYAERTFTENQTEINATSLKIKVNSGK
jgi:nitrate/TMAO reductase-like tetraheme cytochrome c subunit